MHFINTTHCQLAKNNEPEFICVDKKKETLQQSSYTRILFYFPSQQMSGELIGSI